MYRNVPCSLRCSAIDRQLKAFGQQRLHHEPHLTFLRVRRIASCHTQFGERFACDGFPWSASLQAQRHITAALICCHRENMPYAADQSYQIDHGAPLRSSGWRPGDDRLLGRVADGSLTKRIRPSGRSHRAGHADHQTECNRTEYRDPQGSET
jgi:hypothetical protein